ncbi:hypothetical protein KJS94_03565 [Flavihumibacter rivuli]|uniref:VPS10 domain-containing protein n=1 Tax=Flavihumibacter rivuli TaxID=2838156 RepID=UPI001BDE438D|nr:hypothetical protein [Flavihumibacter rivuli]ULQ57277.1 hypothetical protein KJS94_03565 [Flavihumibacter rivuli]
MLSFPSIFRPALFTGLVLALVSNQNYAQIKPTSAEERLKSLQNRVALEQNSLVNDIPFRNIGPTVMSGRVVDIDANPEDPTEFYVAYATGGLWHTVNNGQSFTPIFDNESIIGIGDIAVNWSNRTIWVGTGEVNSSRSSYAGMGIYKSSNNGKSWEYTGLPESHHIGKIQLHPSDPNTAWVAVLGHLYSPNKERGVYKTTDGGKTWKQALFVDENTGAVDLDINPANPNEVYAAMWYRTRRAWNFEESGKTSGIYKSTDGGNNWQLVSGPGSGFIHGDGVGRIGVAVFPANPQTVYAVVDNQFPLPDTSTKKVDTIYQLKDFKALTKEQFLALDDNKLNKFMRANRMPQKYTAASVKEMVKADKIKPTAIHDYLFVDDGFQNKSITGCEVYRSDDGGKTWKKTHEKPIGIYNTYGYYFGKIYVSPYDANKVHILGFYAQMSTDGGKNFKTIDKNNVHADHHALWINPKKDSHIINGNDGGCNISYDNGENWFKANTPAVGQFYAINVDNAKPYNVYGGLQDNGSWYGPSTHKEDIGWMDNGDYAYKMLNGGDGMQVQVDTRDNKTVYSGFQFGVYSRLNKESKERKGIRPQHELGEYPLRFNWQTPILLSQHNQDILYYATNRFHRSMDKGETMQAMSGDLTGGPRQGDVPFGSITTIAESPLRFGLLYTGSDDGLLHRSKDGGYTWTPIGKPAKKIPELPQGLYVSRIVASAYKEGRVYVTLNGYRDDHFNAYVYVSEDYGDTWSQIGKNLPLEPVNVIREDPKSDSILYVGTDGGLYVSIDAGQSFMAMNNGLPKSIPVHDIAIHKGENELVLGTHGRSLYIAKLNDVQKLLVDKAYYEKKKAEAEQRQPKSPVKQEDKL